MLHSFDFDIYDQCSPCITKHRHQDDHPVQNGVKTIDIGIAHAEVTINDSNDSSVTTYNHQDSRPLPNGVKTIANGVEHLTEETLDFIGLGFGPSHLALAIAAEEKAQRMNVKFNAIYLDAKEDFTWHSGMLMDDSQLQVAFLKDLITMINPQSYFTFINYLHKHDRLHEFINLRTFYPTRLEYNDYYRWVANHFRDDVRYGSKITKVSPDVKQDGSVSRLMVTVEKMDTGMKETYYTSNLSIALGGEPHIPKGVQITHGKRICHSTNTVHCLNKSFSDIAGSYHFVIVGSGQTAADIMYHLINHYPNARITVAIRGFAFKPQDDTHFVNELFFPEMTDLFYNLSDEKRKKLIAHHRDVTHSAADMDLLPKIYSSMYQDKVQGRNRISIRRFHELKSAEENDTEVKAIFTEVNTGATLDITADALIMATGYNLKQPLAILKEVHPYLQFTANGTYVVKRNYYIDRKVGFTPKIYLQGYCEATHGFSEVLLSLLPFRSDCILNDINQALMEPKKDAMPTVVTRSIADTSMEIC